MRAIQTNHNVDEEVRGVSWSDSRLPFVIGDIHGCYETFISLIQKYWNPRTHKLVLLGDLIDRGTNSLAMIRKAKELEKQKNAIVLRGNHEDIFLAWLNNYHGWVDVDHSGREKDFYANNLGDMTIYSLLKDINFAKKVIETYKWDKALTCNYNMLWNMTQLLHQKTLKNSLLPTLIQNHFKREIAFLKQTPTYVEWKNYVFVHAGVDLYLSDWRNSSYRTFLFTREIFHHAKNQTGKKFVFGHTTTDVLHQYHPSKKKDENVTEEDFIVNTMHGPWISPCQTKIGIDGGCVQQNYLHGLSFQKDGSFVVCSMPYQKEKM